MDPYHLLPNIPPEIISNILSRLPIKPLCRFKSVSKPWLSAIDNFVKTLLEKKSQKLILASNTYPCSFYTLDPHFSNDLEEIKNSSESWFEIIGSCNGILLLRSSFCTLFLWNPFTRERRLITSPGSFRNTIVQGLGYDSARDDIKVVMVIVHTGDPDETNRAYVFSFVSNYWKRIENFGYKKYSSAPGVIINGSPHWIVSRLGRSNVIVYFDPYEEMFEELPIPILGSKFRLTVLGGDLCGVYDNNSDNSAEVWVMKGSSWSKMFVMPRGQVGFSARMFTPLCFVGEEEELDGEFVVVQLNYRGLALYNLKENRFEKIELPQDCDRFSAACYVETLVSP